MKRRKSIFIPPGRVIVMILAIAAILGLLFSVILNGALAGAIVGLVVAAAFYLFIVVNARNQAKKLKRR
ncbi:MAG: hypothetical protein ABL308_06395 [Oceanicaulis sp.]